MPQQEKQRQQGSSKCSRQQRVRERRLRTNQSVPRLRHDWHTPEKSKYILHPKTLIQHADGQYPCNKRERFNNPFDVSFILNQESHDKKPAGGVPDEAKLIDDSARLEGKQKEKRNHMKKRPDQENFIDRTEPSGKTAHA